MNKVQRCRNLDLNSLYEEVLRLLTNFDHISCRHVYRERNTKEEFLSKDGLILELGTWKFLEKKDAEVFEFYHRRFVDTVPAANS